MVPAMRKRIFLILSTLLIVGLLLRILLFNGVLLAEQSNYRQQTHLPVVIAVYYEALCPDSKHFITKQLLPTFHRASSIIDVHLVPYGKAKTHLNNDGTYSFDCQHGQLECAANIYHACTIDKIKNLQAQINVVACMIRDNSKPKEAMNKCAKEYNIENIEDIHQCFTSSNGSNLLKVNGEETNALRPLVSFIPTITLDGHQGKQAAILKDLFGQVCKIATGNENADNICKEQISLLE